MILTGSSQNMEYEYNILIYNAVHTHRKSKHILTSRLQFCLFSNANDSNPYNIAGATTILQSFSFNHAGSCQSQIIPDTILQPSTLPALSLHQAQVPYVLYADVKPSTFLVVFLTTSAVVKIYLVTLHCLPVSALTVP